MQRAKIPIIVQARLESARFPEKVLKPIMGQPMILWQLDRLCQVTHPRRIIIALADTVANREILAPLLRKHGYQVALPKCHAYDVLKRYALIVDEYYRLEEINVYRPVVRVTGDCPMIDPEVIDMAIDLYMDRIINRRPYVALAQEWPDGLDVEVLHGLDICNADQLANLRSDREHVTPYIWRQLVAHENQFYLPCPFDLSDEKWSVDTPGDFDFVNSIITYLSSQRQGLWHWRDVMFCSRVYNTTRTARAVRNAAYMQQVKEEQGVTESDWNTYRYGQPGGEAVQGS